MPDPQPQPGQDVTPRPPRGDFQFLKVYTKDRSCETPHSPDVFAMEWKPESDVNLRTAVRQVGPADYEVTLTITATARLGETTAFLVEVQQAGIFKIVGLTSEELAPVLGAYCPSMLYPYVREVVSDLVARGGFPPFLLAPVNFEALFAERGGEAGAASEAQAPQPGAG